MRSSAWIFLKCSLILPGLLGKQVQSGQWYNLQSQKVFLHLRISKLFFSLRTDGWQKQLVAGDKLFRRTLKTWSSPLGSVDESTNSRESCRGDFAFCSFCELPLSSTNSGLLIGFIMRSFEEPWSVTDCELEVFGVVVINCVAAALISSVWLVRTLEGAATWVIWRLPCSMPETCAMFVSGCCTVVLFSSDIWRSVTCRQGSNSIASSGACLDKLVSVSLAVCSMSISVDCSATYGGMSVFTSLILWRLLCEGSVDIEVSWLSSPPKKTLQQLELNFWHRTRTT